MNKEKADFLRSLFFYIVSFVGLMIFIFSIVNFISGFFSVGYPVSKPPLPLTPGTSEPVPPPVPYIQVDVRSLINSGTAAVVGFFLWIFSWRIIQKEHTEKLNEDK